MDLDKLLKTVGDALNGIAYVDDCQIMDRNATLSLKDSDPRTEIIVYRL